MASQDENEFQSSQRQIISQTNVFSGVQSKEAKGIGFRFIRFWCPLVKEKECFHSSTGHLFSCSNCSWGQFDKGQKPCFDSFQVQLGQIHFFFYVEMEMGNGKHIRMA